MAGYQRLVSYLYEYREGVKGENVGYAKLEIRDQAAKMIVSIRLRSGISGSCPVEFYYREGRQAYRIPTGSSLELTGGRCEERVLLPGATVGETELSVGQMNGIMILLPDELIGSSWDDQGVPELAECGEYDASRAGETDEAEEVGRTGEAGQTEEVGETAEIHAAGKKYVGSELHTAELAVADVESGDVTEEEELTGKAPESGDVSEISGTSKISAESEDVSASECREHTMCLECPERTERISRPTECVRRPAEPECPTAVQPDGISVEYFFDHGTKMCPFEDGEITGCVRIEPADLEFFPRETWILGSNSFLLHGYYTYGHLILGKLKGMGQESSIIGVPGLYQNRERFLAKMFGFEHFKPVGKSRTEDGDFGYWYLCLPDSCR